MNSLALSDKWDLSLTVGGNIAVVSGSARVAQDVASYERVFLGEGWYDTQAGIPYLLRELAALPPAELVIERARRRGLQVPGAAGIDVKLIEFDHRVLRGEIFVTTDSGEELKVVL